MRRLGWILAGALVVLAGRAVAYAVEPSPLARTLREQVGGPRLPVVAVVALGAGLGVASAIVWLAALGVRERAVLERREAPRLRLGPLLARAVCLWLATALAFVLLESYVHWRAGLGWHGLHCLLGPVHSDALPILAALSVVASATFEAVEHVLRWIRRTLDLIRSRPVAPATTVVPAARPPAPAVRRPLVTQLAARPPPLSVA